MPNQPPGCPRTDLDDYKPDPESEKWHYDSHLMSKIYGKQQNEWYKRMMMGYGVQKLKLSSGMHLTGGTLMLTVEQSAKDAVVKAQDAVNVWMEYDGATKESYVCLREMQNWDGEHKGIHVHWTLFMDEKTRKEDVFKSEEQKKDDDSKATPMPAPSMDEMMKEHMISNEFGFVKKLHFKPSMRAPEDSNYAFCQTQRFLPQNFSDVHESTVMVSLAHHIPAHAAFESMKKYQLHQMELMKGKQMGHENLLNKE